MILLWMIVLFVTVPLAELALLIWVGARIGTLTTIGIVIFTGVLGATLARLQGVAAWKRFQERTAKGELPQGDLIDGLLILIAGAVLLTPGLITDVAGFLLLVPPVRATIRSAIAVRLGKRFVMSPLGGESPQQTPPRTPGPSDDVVDAEYTVEDP